jgi:hypothetical protein
VCWVEVRLSYRPARCTGRISRPGLEVVSGHQPLSAVALLQNSHLTVVFNAVLLRILANPYCHALLRALSLQEFELPGIGSIGGFSGDRKSSEFFFSFTSERGRPTGGSCNAAGTAWWTFVSLACRTIRNLRTCRSYYSSDAPPTAVLFI